MTKKQTASDPRTFPQRVADFEQGARLNAEAATRRGDDVNALRFWATAMAYARASREYDKVRGKQPSFTDRGNVEAYAEQVNLCGEKIKGIERIEVRQSRYVDTYGEAKSA